MCFQGQSTATIRQTDTPRERVAQQRVNLGVPAEEPDFADNLIQEARKRQAAQLLTKSNRRDALENNPGSSAPVSYSLLGK